MRTSIVFAFILGFVGFVTSFGAHIVAVNLPVYAKQVGISLGMIGVLIAAYDAAEVIAKPVFGALADRRGMKNPLLAGCRLGPGVWLLWFWGTATRAVAVRSGARAHIGPGTARRWSRPVAARRAL